MRRAFAFLSILLLAACEEPPPQATLNEIPAQFVGEWATSRGDCGLGGPQAITIGATRMELEVAAVDVTGVAPDGEHAARIDGHFTGPGAEWDGSVRLELGDGVLSVVSGTPVVPRVKCP